MSYISQVFKPDDIMRFWQAIWSGEVRNDCSNDDLNIDSGLFQGINSYLQFCKPRKYWGTWGLSLTGTIFSHVPKGTIIRGPLVSESHSSISTLFFPRFNFFGKEIEAQRTGGLIKVDILALNLIALHKQLVF
jgi:hypothetical protein